MHRHLLAQSHDFVVALAVFERRNVGRRLGRRRSQNVFQHPHTALHRRSSEVLLPGERKHAALSKQSAPISQIRAQSDAAELRAIDVRDTVVLRQPFVEKGVVGSQQIDDAAISLIMLSKSSSVSRRKLLRSSSSQFG
jgi:hypothetical protein